MQGKRLILPAILVFLGFGLGACSTAPTTPSALSQQAADDIAVQAAGSLTGASGGLMLEVDASAGSVPQNGALRFRPGDPPSRVGRSYPIGDTPGGTTPALRFNAGGLPVRTIETGSSGSGDPAHDSGLASAAETTFTAGSITYTVTRTFYDADGNALADYGSTATRLRITASASGSISNQLWSASVGRAGILDVTGIETSQDTLQFDGAGNDTVQCHFMSYDGTRERYFYALGGRSLEAVRLLKNRDANPYPLSGKARWAWSVDRLRSNNKEDVEAHYTALVVVTFNGTADPEIVVDGTYHYHVNLSTGAITRV